MEERRFAVLIDSDNVSPKYTTYVLNEISNYGLITYKRVYGDWTEQNKESWKKAALGHAIVPIQQYSYTTGKNATDSSMIIDAMDILYSGNVEGFCLVSSDSDFTRLAIRLRESGMIVVGMGEKKTPKSFTISCNQFKYLENLASDEEAGASVPVTDLKLIADSIINIICETESEESGMNAGDLKSRLVNRFPDFDVRNYGYTKFSSFLGNISQVTLKAKGNIVALKQNRSEIGELRRFAVNIVSASRRGCLNMGEVNSRILEQYPGFNIKELGYSKFVKFINDIPELYIDNHNNVSLRQ